MSTHRICSGIGRIACLSERTGLPELCLVDTAADVVLVFRRSTPRRRSFDVVLELDRDAALTSPLLPGFSLSLTALFDAG